jgi:hypothetical protein
MWWFNWKFEIIVRRCFLNEYHDYCYCFFIIKNDNSSFELHYTTEDKQKKDVERNKFASCCCFLFNFYIMKKKCFSFNNTLIMFFFRFVFSFAWSSRFEYFNFKKIIFIIIKLQQVFMISRNENDDVKYDMF